MLLPWIALLASLTAADVDADKAALVSGLRVVIGQTLEGQSFPFYDQRDVSVLFGTVTLRTNGSHSVKDPLNTLAVSLGDLAPAPGQTNTWTTRMHFDAPIVGHMHTEVADGPSVGSDDSGNAHVDLATVITYKVVVDGNGQPIPSPTTGHAQIDLIVQATDLEGSVSDATFSVVDDVPLVGSVIDGMLQDATNDFVQDNKDALLAQVNASFAAADQQHALRMDYDKFFTLFQPGQ